MSYKIAKVEKLPNNEAEIVGEIPLDFLTESKKVAVKNLNESLTLPGFRKGQIPEDILTKSVGEMHILEETAEIALGQEYPNIVAETKLRPMMRPHISITKMAPGIPLEFKIQLVLEPDFELPDYKKLASEVKEEEDLKKRPLLILESIAKATSLEVPKKFVDHEVEHLMHHFIEDLEKAGIKLDAYLKEIKKTEEEMRQSWREQIESRAKSELVLSKIAEKENLKTYKEVFDLFEKK